jgi:hypothetical protein
MRTFRIDGESPRTAARAVGYCVARRNQTERILIYVNEQRESPLTMTTPRQE